MTKTELLETHPDYDANLDAWKFFINAYEGGDAYRGAQDRDGDYYLLQHPFESDDNFKRRRKIAHYYNYCSPIVDVLTSYVSKTPPKRSYGELSSDVVPPRQPKTLFDAFWWDCDLEGTNFEQYMRDAQRYASIYGRVSVIVDKPAVTVATQAQAAEQGIRPYLNTVTPENLLNWAHAKLRTGRKVLSHVKIMESETEVKIWTRFGWQLWEVYPDSENAEMIGSGFHALGEIPIVNLYNKKTAKKMVGVSDIHDIAEINKNIYNNCSNAGEIISNTAYPMLALPYEKEGSDGDESGQEPKGPRNIQEFDPNMPNGKPFWLEAPHSSLAEIRSWIEQDAQEMVRIAKMGGIRNIEKSKQPWSGVAIEGTENQLFAALVGKATNSEQAELDIFRFYAMWEDTEFTGNVEYSKEFAVRDVTIALQNAMTAGTAGVKSLTFEKERQKKVVDATLSDMEEVTRETIHKEIDELKDLPTPVATNSGVSGGSDESGGEGE